MNVNLFLKRFSIVLSVLSVLAYIIGLADQGWGEYSLAWMGITAVWIGFIWTCYWVLSGLFFPERPKE